MAPESSSPSSLDAHSPRTGLLSEQHVPGRRAFVVGRLVHLYRRNLTAARSRLHGNLAYRECVGGNVRLAAIERQILTPVHEIADVEQFQALTVIPGDYIQVPMPVVCGWAPNPLVPAPDAVVQPSYRSHPAIDQICNRATMRLNGFFMARPYHRVL